MSREPWSEERLGAAFRALAGSVVAPGDMVRSTMDRLGTAKRSPSWSFDVARPALAALAVAVLGIGIATALVIDRGNTTAAETAHGLPILTVAEALSVHDGGSDRTIAVRGNVWVPSVIWLARCRPFDTNPVGLYCPGNRAWVLDAAEPLVGSPGASPPAGRIGFNPVFPTVDTSELQSDGSVTQLPETVLIGHFHDRRAIPSLCDGDVSLCDSFVVDAIHEVDGEVQPSPSEGDAGRFGGQSAEWTPSDVDGRMASLAPGAEVLVRVSIAGEDLYILEPALGTGALGLIDRSFIWHVTALDARDPGAARTQTYLLVDGTDTAYVSTDWAVSDVGFVEILPTVAASPLPTPTATPIASPSPAVGFPAQLLGLEVISVADAIARRDAEQVDDAALAVAGLYVEPDGPPPSCPAPPSDASPIAMRCPDGFRRLVQPDGPAMNPIIRPEIAFDVDTAVNGDERRPVPIVLLGHFGDWRAVTADERRHFVVDAVLWMDGRVVTPSVVNLDATPVTDSAVVGTLIDARLGPAAASWPTVMTRDWQQRLDPVDAPAFEGAQSLWRVRRLVEEAGRHVVRTAWVIDGDDRVWSEGGCGGCVTPPPSHTLEIGRESDGAVILDVLDSAGIVAGVRRADGAPLALGEARRVPGVDGHPTIELAAVTNQQDELWISWLGGRCDTRWSLSVMDDGPSISLSHPSRGVCRLAARVRRIVLTFSEPIDVDAVNVVHVPTGD